MNPRVRSAVPKAVKWGGAGLTVLLLVVWVGSAWLLASWSWPYGCLTQVREGVVRVERDVAVYETPSIFERDVISEHAFRLDWRFKFRDYGNNWVAEVPLWALTLPTLALTIFAWHRDAAIRRRLRSGCCPCGYDRAGLAAMSVCPECGAQAETR